MLEPHRDRVTWDAPIHSWADVEALPFPPRCLNCKPSRFGSLERLFEFYDRCAEHGIAPLRRRAVRARCRPDPDPVARGALPSRRPQRRRARRLQRPPPPARASHEPARPSPGPRRLPRRRLGPAAARRYPAFDAPRPPRNGRPLRGDTDGAASAEPPDPCVLITVKDAAPVFGATPHKPTTKTVGGVRSCTFSVGHRTMTVQTRTLASATAFSASIKAIRGLVLPSRASPTPTPPRTARRCCSGRRAPRSPSSSWASTRCSRPSRRSLPPRSAASEPGRFDPGLPGRYSYCSASAR